MKKIIYTTLLPVLLFVVNVARADVSISSVAVPAAAVNQGTATHVVYIAQMSVTTAAATVSSIQVILSGTHDAGDLQTLRVYFNATNPTIAGASNLNNVTATFAAPHTYNIGLTRAMAAGSSGYFIIAADIQSAATDNNTFFVNGATNPLVFGFTAAQTVNNMQTNAAGIQTIEAADITVGSTAVPAATINQGTTVQLVYVAQMSVANQPVNITGMQFTLSGTHDADDIQTVRVYFNATNPTIAGASNLNNVSGAFAAPRLYNVGLSRSMAAGSSGYFLIAIDLTNTATDNNTIQVNGAANPVTFSYSTAPNVVSTQTNSAGIQTIEAADITVGSAAVPAATINQGTTVQLVYVAQMSVANQPVNVTGIQFTLSGTHDADDIQTVRVYFNATNPTIAGASNLNNVSGAFAAPRLYNVGLSRAMAAGSSGYFIVAIDLTTTATDNNTIQVNGAANPVTFSYSTAPNVVSTQTNSAGIQTIEAADITVGSTAVPAATINQGTTVQLVYVAQMNVANQPVNVTGMQFTLSGTHDADDIQTVRVYFNATNPTIAGASNLNNVSGAFAAPRLYNVGLSRAMAAGSSGYFLIAIDLTSTATDNNTIQVNGAANPVTFSYSTAPNVVSTQTNSAGIQTIEAADITVGSTAVPAATINQGTTVQLVYVAQMNVANQPVNVTGMQFTLSGTHDADDIQTVRVYFNATNPTIAGASNLNNVSGAFAAPRLYNVGLSRAMAAGSSGYFIVAIDLTTTATDNNTIQVNGAANPVTFSYSTAPNVVSTQTNSAGIQTIEAADITYTSAAVPAGSFAPGSTSRIVNITSMGVLFQPVNVTGIQFTLTGTHDADDLQTVRIYFNPNNPTIAGASNLNNVSGLFAAPRNYNIGMSRAMAAGSSGYFIIAVDATATATIGNTVQVNAAANPVTFSYSTAPNIFNNQTDVSGIQTLPVTFISAGAYAAGNAIQINWQVNAEKNLQQYLVERSADGSSFTNIGQVGVTGNGQAVTNYGFLDVHPLTTTSFYRVVAVDKDGKRLYSAVIKVSQQKGRPEIVVSPNPAPRNTALNLQLNNLEQGMYSITLLNASGQTLATRTLQQIGGNTVIRYELPALASGMYQVLLTGNGFRSAQRIIVR